MPFLSQALTRGAYFLQIFPRQDDQMYTAYQCREKLEQKAPGSINRKLAKHYEQRQRLILRVEKSRWQVWIEATSSSEEKNGSSQEDVSLESIDLKLSEEKNKSSEVIRSRPSFLKRACFLLKKN